MHDPCRSPTVFSKLDGLTRLLAPLLPAPQHPVAGRVRRRQLEALPADTRRLLQLAAADPSGDWVLRCR